MTSALSMLKDIELFRDLNDLELQRVQSLAVEHTFRRGVYIFMEGQERDAVFFIQRGLVKVFKVDEEGREHVVNILGRSAMFPHVGFFDHSPYQGTAQAMEDSILFAILSSKFEALLTEYPSIAFKVMRVMGGKILQLQAKLQELATFDARDRVVALLRHLADEHGAPQDDGIHVPISVTHSDLAHMIGMTRESVNRIWNQLRREGLIVVNKDEWVLSSTL